jgi:hypothetical protein
MPGILMHHLPADDAPSLQEPVIAPNLFGHWREVIR